MDKFYALAEPTRRTILELLASRGRLPATEIYDHFSVSHPAISQHLKVLREAGLVTMEKHAQQHIYQVNPQAMFELGDWARQVAQRWTERFDALDLLVKAEIQKDIKN
jgi:DNA-binding transcriptional ArsR family regulator